MGRMELDRGDVAACAGLAAAWTLTAVAIGVHGEFPISDSWSHARAAHVLIETGELKVLKWTFSPILTNLGVGFLAGLPAGFSFEALRLSSVVAGLLGTLGTYALCRRMGATAGWAAFGAAVYGWNPLHLALSYTFMTDVVFAACCTGSLFFLAKAVGEDFAWHRWLVGAVFAGLAIASRHAGIAILVAGALAATALWVRNARQARRGLLVGAAAVAAVVIAAFAVDLDGKTPIDIFIWYIRVVLFSPNVPYNLLTNGAMVAAYLGIFLAPFVVLAVPGPAPGRTLGIAMATAAGVLAVAWKWNLGTPLGIDWVRDLGLGPISVAGSPPPGPGAGLWWALAALGGLFAGALLFRVAGSAVGLWGDPRRRAEYVLLLAFPVVMLTLLAFRKPMFDRYLVPALPPLIALALTVRARPAGLSRVLVGAVLAAGLVWFAVAGTRDYLEHHRARAQLLARLLAAGVAPEEIDGGNEFGGWHLFGKAHATERGNRRWVVDDVYVLGFDVERPGYHAVASADYRSWLPGEPGRLFVLRRGEAGPPLPPLSATTVEAYDPARIREPDELGGPHYR